MPATLFSAPGQVVIDPAGTPITINKDQQLGALVLSFGKDVFPRTTQKSSQPQDYVQTGSTVTMQMSITDMAIKLQMMALAYGTTVITNAGKQRVGISDNSGAIISGKNVIIKPYVGDLVSTVVNDFIYLYNCQITDLSGTNFTYDLRTQAEIRLLFTACPDPTTGLKANVGDATA